MTAPLTPGQKRAATWAQKRADGAAKRPRKPTPIFPPAFPEDPPKTAAELAMEADILRRLKEINRTLEQRCMDRAVVLAQQAARGHGPLVAHFRELGRRYGHLLEAPTKPKLTPTAHNLRLVSG